MLKELQVMLVLLLVSSYAITTPSSDSEPDFSMAFKQVIDCCANMLIYYILTALFFTTGTINYFRTRTGVAFSVLIYFGQRTGTI